MRSERAYVDLKTRLLEGDFPLNVRLGEEKLAGLLGVSRTPVREALVRLHTEGIVARGLDGGFIPSVPDASGVRNLYEIRIGLELQGLRRPRQHGGHHDPVLLGSLRQEWLTFADEEIQGPDPGFVHLDEAFHVALCEAAGNPELAELLRQINDRIRVVRMQDFLTAERIVETIHEHLGILDAVLAGELVEAEARFSAHLERSLLVVEERVASVVARMARGGAQ